MQGHIPFGIRNGKIITIDDIKPFERGTLCYCFCPNCEKPLIAVLESDYQIPHFRHKKGQIHCHFQYDEIILEHILKLLGEIDSKVLDQIINHGIEHFAIKNKLNINEVIKDKVRVVSKPTFFQNDKKEIYFKVIIDGIDFQIRITTRKKVENSNEKEIIVSISDLLKSKESTTRLKIEEIVKELSSRISGIVSDNLDNRYIENKKGFNESEHIFEDSYNVDTSPKNTHVETKKDDFKDDQFIEKLNTEFKPDFTDNKIRNHTCPRCKEGKLSFLFSKKGKPFIGCANYPKCNYIHYENAYYDEEEEKWFYHKGR
jgi:ssDNA-binding Zn-finger/Zn-ribbon topoisomerase 1